MTAMVDVDGGNGYNHPMIKRDDGHTGVVVVLSPSSSQSSFPSPSCRPLNALLFTSPLVVVVVPNPPIPNNLVHHPSPPPHPFVGPSTNIARVSWCCNPSSPSPVPHHPPLLSIIPIPPCPLFAHHHVPCGVFCLPIPGCNCHCHCGSHLPPLPPCCPIITPPWWGGLVVMSLVICHWSIPHPHLRQFVYHLFPADRAGKEVSGVQNGGGESPE